MAEFCPNSRREEIFSTHVCGLRFGVEKINDVAKMYNEALDEDVVEPPQIFSAPATASDGVPNGELGFIRKFIIDDYLSNRSANQKK